MAVIIFQDIKKVNFQIGESTLKSLIKLTHPIV